MERTPPQIRQMATWAEERDTILGEISAAKTEKGILTDENKRLSDSNKDIDSRIATKTVALGKLEAEDRDRILIVSAECVEIEKNKTRLETTLGSLNSEIREKRREKSELAEDVKLLQSLHDKTFSRTGVLDKVIDRVVRVSEGNIQDVQAFAASMREVLTQFSEAFEATVASGTRTIEALSNTSKTFSEKVNRSARKNTPKKGINS